MVLETVETTVAEAVRTTDPAPTAAATPTPPITRAAPASERPAPTIVLLLDNSNNESRPSLHRAGRWSG